MRGKTAEKSPVDVITLANTLILQPDGSKIRFGMLWQGQKTIFLFLRHFACIACRAHASQVWKDRSRYEKEGARIVFIGNGQPHFIQKFKEELNLGPAVVLTDPSLESFRAVGFKRGFFTVVQPKSAINAVKLAAQGHRQGTYSKDAGTHWQLGGVVVITPEGKIPYHYISQALGDFPPDEDVEKIS